MVVISAETPDGSRRKVRFDRGFVIGRGSECDLRVKREDISRSHAEMYLKGSRWWVRDLGSKNGTFLNGVRIDKARVDDSAVLRLGIDGPELPIRFVGPEDELGDVTDTSPHRSLSFYVQRYLHPEPGDVGERTEAIRLAFARVMGRARRRYLLVIGVVLLLLAGAGTVTVLQHRRMQEQIDLAEEIFYTMKSVELQLAELEQRISEVGDAAAKQELERGRTRFNELQHSYDRFLAELGVYDEETSEEERLILRIARVFGECEVTMPADMVGEVNRFIDKWRDDRRMEVAVKRSRQRQYAPMVAAEMLKVHLPPQFFYIALQESEFRVDACGPETDWGIAKGPWQLIPSTAIAYGLKTGPLYLVRQPDPRDERHDFVKSTRAAARYLRDIYSTEAQASGLLVIASYNWGEGGVRQLINSMPVTPRRRNFWRLLADHRGRLPRQTYHYVLRVFSAAVIGEDPQLFGFDFGNPLAGALASAGP